MSGLDLSDLDKFSRFLKDPQPKAEAEAGTPAQLPLDLIEEDPEQPRKDFNVQGLHELAESIRARGVKTPISVRKHPTLPDHYLINHGARRWRAAKTAGLAAIPAFVDADHELIDQIAENVQRENLTTRELIDAVASLMTDGMKQVEIAKRLGKSKAWVSKFANLRTLPAPIADALADDRCRDSDALVTLKACWNADDEATLRYLARAEDITASDAESFKARLLRPSKSPTQAAGGNSESEASQGSNKGENPEATIKKPVVQIKVDDREGVVILSKPAKYGLVWVEYKDGSQAQVPAGQTALVAVVEGDH